MVLSICFKRKLKILKVLIKENSMSSSGLAHIWCKNGDFSNPHEDKYPWKLGPKIILNLHHLTMKDFLKSTVKDFEQEFSAVKKFLSSWEWWLLFTIALSKYRCFLFFYRTYDLNSVDIRDLLIVSNNFCSFNFTFTK